MGVAEEEVTDGASTTPWSSTSIPERCANILANELDATTRFDFDLAAVFDKGDFAVVLDKGECGGL